MNILIAGASGYIGRALTPELLKKFPQARITALSRSGQVFSDPRVTSRSCDLFSQTSLNEALPDKIDLAFYLVHSMGPTARLDQGSFADYDLLLADNFARVLRTRAVDHLIYLGGLVPTSDDLSLHLRSRVEVEDVFIGHKLPLTILRAGLILGEAGSSFQILLKLVKHLPVMICPAWTQTLTTPVDLPKVLRALVEVSLAKNHIDKTYDLAGCRPLTYLHMMRETSRRMGFRRLFLTVPFFTPTLSRLWVALITGSSKALIYPLIESLRHPMVARSSHQFFADWNQRDYFSLIEDSEMKILERVQSSHLASRANTVRSVQRLPIPPRKNIQWIRDCYFSWLSRFLFSLVRVKEDGLHRRIYLFHRSLCLLILEFDPDKSSSERQFFHIRGGLLVAKDNVGRLEFRSVLNGSYVLAAIHDYRPALPWFIYKQTQARLHALVMRQFGRYLTQVK